MGKSRQSSSTPPAAGWFAGLSVVSLVGFLAIQGAGYVVPKPDPRPNPPNPPGPVDPVDPINVDAEVEAAAELSILHAEEQAEQCRRARVRDRDEVNRRLHGAFDELDSVLDATPDNKFAAVFGALSTGFRTGQKRVNDQAVQRYAVALAENFADAAKLLKSATSAKQAARSADDADRWDQAITQIHFKLQKTNSEAKRRLVDAIVAAKTGAGFTGYLIDREAREHLRATSTPLPLLSIRAPPEMDPRPWHKIEQQGQMGSCQGNALSSVCELAYRISLGDYVHQYRIASGDERPEIERQARRHLGSLFDLAVRDRSGEMQFSRLFAYYASQKRDGILGSDCGSTLAGGLAAASQDGICPEEFMPYPNPVVYTGRFTAGAFEAAKDFKIRRHTVCRSYADVMAFLASGQGGVEIGIRWGNGMMECPSGVIDRYDSSGGGGHAVCFLGYSTRVDRQGRKYLWLANSWGERWGNGGYAEVAPDAVDAMARHPEAVMIGMSDMAIAKARDVSWIGKGSVF